MALIAISDRELIYSTSLTGHQRVFNQAKHRTCSRNAAQKFGERVVESLSPNAVMVILHLEKNSGEQRSTQSW